MQIDIGVLSILVSVCSLAVMIYTVIKNNAKTQAEIIKSNAENQAQTNAKIDLVKNDIKHLTDRVEKHNEVVERTYALEEKQAVLEQQMKVEQHRMDDVEQAVEKNRDKIINLTRR